ncbi:MAG: isochorismatase family cysteine hydrolase [Thermoguttaceae bacterium]
MSNLDEILAARQQRIDRMHRAEPGRTALLVVDMQRGFLDPGAALEVPPGREIIPNIARLIDVCRAKDVPVIFTEFVYSTTVPCLRGDPFGVEHLPAEPGEPTGFGFPSDNCRIGPGIESGVEFGPNSAETVNSSETVGALAPRPDEPVVRSHTYDKFYDTPLDLALRSRDVRYLLITGVVTDVCVNATLMSAATRDYRVTAVTDGVATLWPEIQTACFEIWRRKFARLRTTSQLVEEIGAF